MLAGLTVISREGVRLNDKQPSASYILDTSQVSRLRYLGNAKCSSIRRPQVFFVLAPDEALEIESPKHFFGMREIQSRERYFYGDGPAITDDTRVRAPHPIPTSIEIDVRVVFLLFDDQAIHLCPQRIDLEDVTSTPVMIRIDENLEVVIQILANIAAEFPGDDARRIRIETMNAKIDGVSRVQNPHFCFLSRWLALERFPLTKIRDRFCQLPKRIVQSAVKFGSSLHGHSLCHLGVRLRNRRQTPWSSAIRLHGQCDG